MKALVRCPGDFVRADSSSGIGVSPAEWLGGFRIGTDVPPQFVAEIGDRSENTASNHVALYLGEPEFHLIQPGRIRWREMEVYLRMLCKELPDVFGLVR